MFLIIFLVVVWLNRWYAAEEKICPIESSPDILINYIENLRKVTKNIVKNIDASNKSEKSKFTWEALRIYNTIASSIWTWDTYFSTFEFYIILPTISEIPSQIMRDNNTIEKEIDKLNNLLSKIVLKWLWDQKIEWVCNWVSDCKLKWSAIEIMSVLIENTTNIWNFYRLSLLDRLKEYEWEFILVPDNFKSEMLKYYNKFTIWDCSRDEDWFFSRIWTAIKKISDKQNWWFNWIKYWKEWYSLLTWESPLKDYRERERQLLAKELSRQWLSQDNSSIILWNLDRYNKTWKPSIENNFITNSINSLKRELRDNYDDFLKAVDDQLKDTNSNRDYYFTEEMLWRSEDISSTLDIENRVKELYQSESEYASNQDISVEKIIKNIINIHINITQAINILDKTIPISRKVCNKQDVWEWKCD